MSTAKTAKQEKAAPSTSFFGNLLQTGLYKRNQGRIARQVTFAAAWILISLGAWRMSETYGLSDIHMRLTVPALLVLFGFWFAYRLVNLPTFAEFLIGVEAEMVKVSWPTRAELIRGSMVVLFTIFFLAALLYSYDLFWNTVFWFIGIVPDQPQ
ncbi:MAG: preprotein translocase subunit SecE [Planctomycetota bacterium]|nr:MAG: preprotein translocase subunit SecE [Planctomycetota bacterium]REJ97205.1 MAG: preprotein translocase subunit SecE [Planctomycetota bacterium]REK28019.1 MAG: preprotein translocase subunit SecE [Planctomycetota bacterium]REK48727.1 MAG: preprotein translocase subunit SecE [Planctomycetota bacterium]